MRPGTWRIRVISPGGVSEPSWVRFTAGREETLRAVLRFELETHPVFTNEMTIDEAVLMYGDGRPDCNGNGIPDSVDIARGYAEDENHNGVIDDCEPDSVVHSRIKDGSWRRAAFAVDTSFFAVRQSITVVTIDYTVPMGGDRVRLVIKSPHGGIDVSLVDRVQESDSYEVTWTRNPGSAAFPKGEYAVELIVGRHRYERRIAWGY